MTANKWLLPNKQGVADTADNIGYYDINTNLIHGE